MKSQATRCTQKELAMLAYWEERGIQIRRDQPIPMSTTDRQDYMDSNIIADFLLGMGVIICIVSGIGFWIGRAAGVL